MKLTLTNLMGNILKNQEFYDFSMNDDNQSTSWNSKVRANNVIMLTHGGNNNSDILEQLRQLLNTGRPTRGQFEERHSVNLGRVVSYPTASQNNRSHDSCQICKFLQCLNISSLPHVWIIDNGTTDHMCGPNIKLSNPILLPKPIKVHLPNLGAPWSSVWSHKE